ncbi:MAG TPA: SRPBCC family protein [Caulobacteraceae bacterium]|jgi:uncharacterized protein YndB with AHSA1/START domain|nr:SRPBCC family protein [Caulobacteraceae bacterium]
MKTSFTMALAAALSLAGSSWGQSHDGHATGASETPHVVDSSFTTADGARDLQQSVVIEAPAHVLYQGYMDPKEFAKWNAPFSAVDLRVGGTFEAAYDATHKAGDPDNIKHRIITFLPDRLVVFQNIQAPKGLKGAQAFQRTVIVLQYEPLGPSRTRVTLSCTGWGQDADSEKLYGFFRAGNAYLLEKMKSVYDGAKS